MKPRKYYFSFAISSIAALFIAAFGFIISVADCRAQAASQTTPSTSNVPYNLTLDDAIRSAIARNYAVRTTKNAARSGEIEVTRSKDNMWLPTVSATGSWGYGYSLVPLAERQSAIPQTVEIPTSTGSDTIITGVIINGPQQLLTTPAGAYSLSWSASANLNLFNGGADISRINAAEASRDAAQNISTWTRQQTAFNVTSDYLNVLRTSELVDAAQKTLAEALAQINLVKGQYDAGVVPIVQVYQQQSIVGQDSLALIQAMNDHENAQTDLLFILNVPPNEYQNYNFSVSGIDTSTTAESRRAVDTSIASARFNSVIDTRPDILAQQENIEASQYGIDITRAALWPQLDASVGIGGKGDNWDLSRVHMANGISAGLTLSVPIYDKMQNRLLIEEKEIDVETQKVQLEQGVQQVRSDAAKAVNNLRAAGKALDASDAALRSATEGLRLASEQLTVGSGTQVSVIVAEATLETARTNRVNAKYNWVLAQRQLAYTLGQWKY